MDNKKPSITVRLLVLTTLIGFAMQSTSASIPEELQATARRAVDLAATRLGIESATITISTAVAVTWPNGALGCPRQEINYTQALVPGYRIELEIAGLIHHYHGRIGGDPFFCAQPEQSSGWIQDR